MTVTTESKQEVFEKSQLQKVKAVSSPLVCETCHESGVEEMISCEHCHSVYYCNKTCEKKDASLHQLWCGMEYPKGIEDVKDNKRGVLFPALSERPTFVQVPIGSPEFYDPSNPMLFKNGLEKAWPITWTCSEENHFIRPERKWKDHSFMIFQKVDDGLGSGAGGKGLEPVNTSALHFTRQFKGGNPITGQLLVMKVKGSPGVRAKVDETTQFEDIQLYEIPDVIIALQEYRSHLQ